MFARNLWTRTFWKRELSQIAKNGELSSVTKLTKNLQLNVRANDRFGEVPPVVVIYSWLLAKSSALGKFRDYYNEKGLDVLTVKIEPADMMWPPKAHQVVDSLLTTLDGSLAGRSVIIHTFSIGGYLYGETLRRCDDHFRERVIGQVIDSPIDFAGVPNGMARTLFKRNPPLMYMAKGAFWSYVLATYPVTFRNYKAASVQFHSAPALAPALWLFSKVDDFMKVEGIERAIAEWEAMGVECRKKCWDDSPHIMHYYNNSKEYISLMDYFLEEITKARLTGYILDDRSETSA